MDYNLAVFYLKEGNNFNLIKSWEDIDIRNREEVKSKQELWKELLYKILNDLNNFFESNTLLESNSIEFISFDNIIDVVLENTDITSHSLINIVRSDSHKEAEINQWWNASYGEYGIEIMTQIKI